MATNARVCIHFLRACVHASVCDSIHHKHICTCMRATTAFVRCEPCITHTRIQVFVQTSLDKHVGADQLRPLTAIPVMPLWPHLPVIIAFPDCTPLSLQVWSLGYGIVYQFTAQLLASAQQTHDVLVADTAHIRLTGNLPPALASRRFLWSAILSMLRLQSGEDSGEHIGSGTPGDAADVDGDVTRAFTAGQQVMDHIVDSKVLTLCVEVLLSSSTPLHVTVRTLVHFHRMVLQWVSLVLW